MFRILKKRNQKKHFTYLFIKTNCLTFWQLQGYMFNGHSISCKFCQNRKNLPFFFNFLMKYIKPDSVSLHFETLRNRTKTWQKSLLIKFWYPDAIKVMISFLKLMHYHWVWEVTIKNSRNRKPSTFSSSEVTCLFPQMLHESNAFFLHCPKLKQDYQQ